jgi:small ligand-binding sensory domain FIST
MLHGKDLGTLELDSQVREGELLKFATVNAAGSAAELEACARAARPRLGASDGPALCLSFVCCGRGVRFQERPNGETSELRRAFPEMAFAGLFAQGEIGPRPFLEAGSEREDEPALMGFTAVHALLRFDSVAVQASSSRAGASG